MEYVEKYILQKINKRTLLKALDVTVDDEEDEKSEKEEIIALISKVQEDDRTRRILYKYVIDNYLSCAISLSINPTLEKAKNDTLQVAFKYIVNYGEPFRKGQFFVLRYKMEKAAQEFEQCKDADFASLLNSLSNATVQDQDVVEDDKPNTEYIAENKLAFKSALWKAGITSLPIVQDDFEALSNDSKEFYQKIVSLQKTSPIVPKAALVSKFMTAIITELGEKWAATPKSNGNREKEFEDMSLAHLKSLPDITATQQLRVYRKEKFGCGKANLVLIYQDQLIIVELKTYNDNKKSSAYKEIQEAIANDEVNRYELLLCHSLPTWKWIILAKWNGYQVYGKQAVPTDD